MYINISKVDFGKYYRGVTPEPEPDYLCFTSTGDSTVAMTQNGTPDTSANKVICFASSKAAFFKNIRCVNLKIRILSFEISDKLYSIFRNIAVNACIFLNVSNWRFNVSCFNKLNHYASPFQIFI